MLERLSSTDNNAADCIARARALAPLIAAHAAQIEQARALAPDVLDALHDARLFRMLIPTGCDGWEADPLIYMQAIEELAKADGSTAWCVVQASGCSVAAAYRARGGSGGFWTSARGDGLGPVRSGRQGDRRRGRLPRLR